MEIELMNEEQIREYLVKQKESKTIEIKQKQQELFNVYKDVEYIIVHHSNEDIVSFGKVTGVEKREGSNHIVDITYNDFSVEYCNNGYRDARQVSLHNEWCVFVSVDGGGTKIKIITQERFNELKELFDSIYNDDKFTQLFDKLKVNK